MLQALARTLEGQTPKRRAGTHAHTRVDFSSGERPVVLHGGRLSGRCRLALGLHREAWRPDRAKLPRASWSRVRLRVRDPAPPWFAFGLFNGSWLWLLVEAFRKRLPDRLVLGTRGAVVVAWLGAVALEALYHVLPHILALGHPTLGIIGDSVTAGTGERKVKTWPGLLADRHGLVVRDHAVAGADVASALTQAASVSSDEQLLLLEIGGNDILGATTAAKFEVGLGDYSPRSAAPDVWS